MKRSKPGIDDSEWVRTHSESKEEAENYIMAVAVGLAVAKSEEENDEHTNPDEHTDGAAEPSDSPA